MWKLPSKRMCSSSINFGSTPGERYQQTEEPKCTGQGEVLLGRATAQQVLLEMQKSREVVASQDIASKGKLQQELKIQL